MKKIFFIFTILILLFLISATLILSTKGVQTDKFNEIIFNEIKKNNSNLAVKFKDIKIKLDLKKINLFLSTKNPDIEYRDINIPTEDIKIYVNFKDLIKKKINIEKLFIKFNKIKIEDLKTLVIELKPSNLKRFFSNNISKGEVKLDISTDFDENFKIKNYKISGKVKNVNINVFDKTKINKAKFNFITENKFTLINSISSEIDGIPITDGEIKIMNNENLVISGFLKNNLLFKNENVTKFLEFTKINNYSKNKIKINGNFNHNFKLFFSESLSLEDYEYKVEGKIINASIIFKDKIENIFLKSKIYKFLSNDTVLELSINKNKESNLKLEGKYKLNKQDQFKKYSLKYNLKNKKSNFKINFNFDEEINFDFLNYNKKKGKLSSISSEIFFSKKDIRIQNFSYKEGLSLILLEGIKLNNKKELKEFKKIKIKTNEDGQDNNNFEIIYGSKIYVKGKKFDASNLIKNITKKNKVNMLKNVNKNIEINFENISTKLSIPLYKFNLIGEIKRGKFVNLSSKSEFGSDKYLDISLKSYKDKRLKKLEVFSDLPKPILSDYSFFKGIEGGKLLFVSDFNDNSSNSNLTIENFKVKNAPGFAKLLSLADFGGMSDLLSGEGISFDTLEIKFSNDKELLKINEIYAIGPSISILMDGYIENKTGLTSLRGTMVPAKELNKLISKIPLIGDILIPKDIGEGLFGVSFKLKGRKGSIKTTVNPIKTITPRFITKGLEKIKKPK